MEGRSAQTTFSTEIFQITAFLIILQLADTAYTLIGINQHGLGIEGNLFLRTLMDQYGIFNALLLAKFMSVMLILVLACLSHRARWVREIMCAISCVYLLGAIIPWTYILASS